jgi:uncharacterized membrane protein HdeD (DUF308 family)
MIDAFFSLGGLITGIIAIAAGVVVLVWPKVLTYVVGIGLIILGLVTAIIALQQL